jgi:hypothetical protein
LQNVERQGEETQSNLEKISEKGALIGTAIVAAAGIAVGALGGLLTKTMETTSQISKFSQVTGMSTKGFQEWDTVAKSVGFSMEAAAGDMAALAERAMDAASGAGENAEMFKKLGVSVTDNNGKLKTQEQLFNETIAGLQGMENITERNAIATAMLSTTGEELAPILNMTAEELQNMKNNANVISDDQLQKASDFTKKWDSAKSTLSGVVTEIGINLMPTFEKILTWVTTNMPTIQKNAEDVFNKIGDAIKWVKDNSDILIPILGGLTGAFIAMKVIGIINALMVAYTAFTTTATGAQLTLSAAMMANPIGLVIAAIAALIAIGVALYMNWDTVKAKVGALWEGIKGAFNNIKGKVSEVMENVKTIVSSAIEKVKGFFNFSWSLPKIKMPHFSVSWSTSGFWGKVGDFLGLPGKPNLDVNWYAKGTNFAPGGLAVVGEEGPELINLPRGSKVNTANQTKQMLGGGSPINIILNYKGDNHLEAYQMVDIIDRELTSRMNSNMYLSGVKEQ